MDGTQSTTDQGEADTLIGWRAIARFMSAELNRRIGRHAVYNWVATGEIPCGKFAGKIVASKQAIRADIAAKARANRRALIG